MKIFTPSLFWTLPLLFLSHLSFTQDYCDADFTDNQFAAIQKVEMKYSRVVEPTGTVDSIDLFLDLYYSSENNQKVQPMMILLHGGSFITELGDKSGMEEIARLMVSKGFVVASISYSTWSIFRGGTPTVDGIVDVVVKAMHDLQSAIEFVVEENGQGVFPEVDVQNLIIGGGSAGAVTTLHRLYIDPDDVLPDFLVTAFENNGGLFETESEDYNIAYGINLSGGIFDTTWINTGEPPLISIHGDKDSTVYYDRGLASGVIELYGSKPIDERMSSVGMDSYFYTFKGGGHTDIYENIPMYRDPLLQVLDTGLTLIQDQLCLMTSTDLPVASADIKLVNTLVSGDLIVENNEGRVMKYDVVDMWGRNVQSGILTQGAQRVRFNAHTSGYFALRVYSSQNGVRNSYQQLFYFNGE